MMNDLRKDCPMRHENGNCTVIGGFCTAVNDPICEGLRNAYDSGYRAALRAQQESKWVSVKDGLPENRKDVLCLLRYGHQRVLKWNALDRWWSGDAGRLSETSVSHWMPLPVPLDTSNEPLTKAYRSRWR